MDGSFWKAVSTMTGCVVGAGILGLPYVVAKAGYLTGLTTIAVLGVMVIFLALCFGEVVLRTKGTHQMIGYAERYLGKAGKYMMTLIFWFSISGALTAYTLGVGASAYSLFGFGQPIMYSLIFFAVGASFIFLGLKVVEDVELIFFIAMLIVLGIICTTAIFYINPENIELAFNPAKLLLPYGVALFAFLGLQAVPEMRIELQRRKRLLKWAIFLGMLIPTTIYLLFPAIIVAVSGKATPEIATTGLGIFIGPIGYIFGNLFAVITMSTSFFILGLAMRDSFMYDYKIPRVLAWMITCAIPLTLVLSGIASFIKIVGLVGIVMGGIEGILVTLMILKAKKHGDRKPEYSMPVNWLVLILLISLFIGGTLSYFIYLA